MSFSRSESEDTPSSISSLDDEVKYDYLGKVLEHRYLILDYLDNGSFCRVYMAYDIQIDKYCAIKVMNYDNKPYWDKESYFGSSMSNIEKLFGSGKENKYLKSYVFSL